MGLHPVNLAFRFLLEVIAYIAMIYWGIKQDAGIIRFFYTGGIPLIAGLIWSLLAVPGDPSRSGKAPMPVSGPIRLIIEFSFFAVAIIMLSEITQSQVWLTYLIILVLHYGLSYDRIIWLLKK